MIAPGQPMHLRLRDHATVQVRVHHWGRVVVEPMEHVHGHTVREPVSQIARRLEVVAGPSTIADERHREEHDRPEPHVGRMPGEGADEEGPANRMVDHGGSVIERAHRLLDGWAPACVAWIILARHPRIADLEVIPEFPRKAVDQLVVPLVVGAFTAALDEQDLLAHADLATSDGRPRIASRAFRRARFFWRAAAAVLRARRSPIPSLSWPMGRSAGR